MGNGDKIETGKLEIYAPFAQFIDAALLSNSFRIRSISVAHLKQVAVLPSFIVIRSTGCWQRNRSSKISRSSRMTELSTLTRCSASGSALRKS